MDKSLPEVHEQRGNLVVYFSKQKATSLGSPSSVDKDSDVIISNLHLRSPLSFLKWVVCGH